MSKLVDPEDTEARLENRHIIDPIRAPENGFTSEPKVDNTKEADDDESDDETRDTSLRTSTRLVKFQLFETKAVSLQEMRSLTLALLYPRLKPK